MYLQDVHVENYASRKKSGAIGALRAICIVMAVVFLAYAMIGINIISFFIAVALAVLAWFLGTRDQIDFDYSFTNGTVDIARVFSKSSRKNYLSFEMSEVTMAAPLDSDRAKAYSGRGLRKYDCTSRIPDRKVYEVVFRNKKSGNNEEIVLMELEDDFINAMKQAAPDVVNV